MLLLDLKGSAASALLSPPMARDYSMNAVYSKDYSVLKIC